ncbi:MAG: hypothetical protein L3J59_00100 [Methylococcaceae bacterium]|nr:hypothetical protein [Methylococcaceae bacterium]
MLHIVDNFPIPSTFLNETQSGDTVIFTDNAVLAVKQENFETESLSQKTFSHINLCVRKADLLIRNISNKDLLRGVVVIDDLQYKSAIDQDFALKSNN